MAYSIPKPRVIFNMGNIRDCMCGKCPVQEKSICAKERLERLAEAMQKDELIKKEDIPKLFCAFGSTPPKDIDQNQECICPNCAVWYKYMLAKEKPMNYYCGQRRK